MILRKAGQSNRSEQGAATQAVLMTVFRTLKPRGLDPIHTITAALRTYIQTCELPRCLRSPLQTAEELQKKKQKEITDGDGVLLRAVQEEGRL